MHVLINLNGKEICAYRKCAITREQFITLPISTAHLYNNAYQCSKLSPSNTATDGEYYLHIYKLCETEDLRNLRSLDRADSREQAMILELTSPGWHCSVIVSHGTEPRASVDNNQQ